MNEDGPYSYRNLRDFLNTLTESQLDQKVQLLPPGNPALLQPVYAAGTIEEMCHVDGKIGTETHSADDFKHHPEQVVLLCDHSPYDEEGNNYFTMEEGGMRGNKTGKLYEFSRRGYGYGGKFKKVIEE